MKNKKKLIATTLAFCYIIGAVPCFVSAMLEGSNEDEQKGQAPQGMSDFLIQSSSESKVYGSSAPMSFSDPPSPTNNSRQRSNFTPNEQNLSILFNQSSSESKVYGSSAPMSFSDPPSPTNNSRQRSILTPYKQISQNIQFVQSSTDQSVYSDILMTVEDQNSEINATDIPASPIRPHNAQETNSASDHLDDSVLDEVHISIKDRMKHPFVNYPKTSYTGLTILFLALIYKPVKWGYSYLFKDKATH